MGQVIEEEAGTYTGRYLDLVHNHDGYSSGLIDHDQGER